MHARAGLGGTASKGLKLKKLQLLDGGLAVSVPKDLT